MKISCLPATTCITPKGADLQEAGWLNETVECYDRALRDDPGNIRAYARKGAALLDSGRTDEAAECCAGALSPDPRCIPALMNLGLISRAEPEDPSRPSNTTTGQ